jgi:hypothetical protein
VLVIARHKMLVTIFMKNRFMDYSLLLILVVFVVVPFKQ